MTKSEKRYEKQKPDRQEGRLVLVMQAAAAMLSLIRSLVDLWP